MPDITNVTGGIVGGGGFKMPGMDWMSSFTNNFGTYTAKITSMNQVDIMGVLTIIMALVVIVVAFYGMGEISKQKH